jgi:putative DNA primase/helicase
MAASYSDIREALSFIPADLPHQDWWKVGAAIKSERGDGGFDLFDEWSQGADSYKDRATRATWKSTRDNCKIKIGTLFKMAQEYGYKPHTTAHKAVTRRARMKPRSEPTGAAQKYWNNAHDCDSHTYADDKGLDTAGLRTYKGKLLIPAFNAEGKMSSIQEISKDGEKKFLKDCTMSGCWFSIPGDETLVVAEGWATAKSIHLATGHTSVVAFSSSGFMKVPPLLRKKYPTARIILAPDNDESQDAIKKAEKAARLDGCEIIVPDIEGGSDFDDLRQADGLEEIRRQFAGNVEKPQLHDLVVVDAASVEPEKVDWLWPGKFALGKLSLLAGQPSTGKTTISHKIISIVTTGGKWPFSQNHAKQGRAVILTAEDDLADTVIPRLIAAGADRSRIIVIQSVAGDQPKSFSLAHDLHQLEGFLQEYPDTRLIVFDPLSAYLGAADSHRESDVRQVLGPVSQLASDRHVAILGIAHLNKNEGHSAMARILGSTGIVAASRSVYMTLSIDGQLMLLPTKNNLAKHEDAGGYIYAIRSATVADGIETSVIEWTGESDLWANEAMQQEAAESRAPKMMEAKEFLADLLANGPQMQETIEVAAREKGISFRTVRRAQKELDYTSHKHGFGGGWKWYSPGQWQQYQEANSKVVKLVRTPPEPEALGHLHESLEKVQDAQQQEFGHLREKTPTSTGLKPAPDNGFTEGGQETPESSQDDHVKNDEKPAENAKVAKSSCLDILHSDDTFGAI